jgi:sterol desaturase/sphingolipid hydroxylase (fatty acid hydroxylase superfamily)
VYESRLQKPLNRSQFTQRVLLHALVVATLLLLSVGLGMAGYMHFERLSTVDAFLNTAMLLGGMGPVNPPQTDAGKLFAGLFALYAGLVFIVAAALVFVPVLHRLLHRFHWDSDQS